MHASDSWLASLLWLADASPSADFWLRVALISAVVLAVLGIFRMLHRFSKTLFWLILGCLMSVFGYNWVWQRQEPAWATPVVERVADWLGRPSKAGPK